AVGFDPHAAIGFPALFGNQFLDFSIDIWVIVLDVLIELRLRLLENVIRVHFHQADHSREGASGLFTGMLKTPQPSHVDMGMAYAVDGYSMMLLDALQFFLKLLVSESNSFIELVRTRFGIVDQLVAAIQSAQQIMALWFL